MLEKRTTSRHNTKWREGTSEGKKIVQHARKLTDKRNPVACLTRDSNPWTGLAPINPDANEVPPPHPLNQDAIYRFHSAYYRVADVLFGQGPESSFLCRLCRGLNLRGLGMNGSILEIAVGESEIRLWHENHVPCDRTASNGKLGI